jgi:hypothetical protein
MHGLVELQLVSHVKRYQFQSVVKGILHGVILQLRELEIQLSIHSHVPCTFVDNAFKVLDLLVFLEATEVVVFVLRDFAV